MLSEIWWTMSISPPPLRPSLSTSLRMGTASDDPISTSSHPWVTNTPLIQRPRKDTVSAKNVVLATIFFTYFSQVQPIFASAQDDYFIRICYFAIQVQVGWPFRLATPYVTHGQLR